MNKDIVYIGDELIYNGIIPDYVQTEERKGIERRLTIGDLYKITRIRIFRDGCWYWIGLIDIWAPKECFDTRIHYIKEKYDLR